jgi:hypothetical protein
MQCHEIEWSQTKVIGATSVQTQSDGRFHRELILPDPSIQSPCWLGRASEEQLIVGTRRSTAPTSAGKIKWKLPRSSIPFWLSIDLNGSADPQPEDQAMTRRRINTAAAAIVASVVAVTTGVPEATANSSIEVASEATVTRCLSKRSPALIGLCLFMEMATAIGSAIVAEYAWQVGKCTWLRRASLPKCLRDPYR